MYVYVCMGGRGTRGRKEDKGKKEDVNPVAATTSYRQESANKTLPLFTKSCTQQL